MISYIETVTRALFLFIKKKLHYHKRDRLSSISFTFMQPSVFNVSTNHIAEKIIRNIMINDAEINDKKNIACKDLK